MIYISIIIIAEPIKDRILSVDYKSAHYRPDIRSLAKVDAALQKLYNKNPNLFDKDSKWKKR